MNRRQIVADALAASVVRLDAVMNPWGFTFESDSVQSSHVGPYASGHYRRAETKIGISCRETIDNIYYRHTFLSVHASCRTMESFEIGHRAMMRGVGHEDDCRLIDFHNYPDEIADRDSGDRVAALIHDWTMFAAPVLREPCEQFYAIMRQGWRCYSVAW